MIHHSMETLNSTRCPAYWMRSCQTPKTSNSNRPYDTNKGLSVLAHTKSMAGGSGAYTLYHALCVIITQVWGWACIIILVPHTLAQGVTYCTAICAIGDKYNFGKYDIFHRPDEAMLFVMLKAYLYLKLICYSEHLRTLFFIYI